MIRSRRDAARFLGQTVVPSLERYPFFGESIRQLIKRGRFSAEERALRGIFEVRNSAPSVLHFTINKSATQFVKRILESAASHSHMEALNLSSYAAWSNEVPYLSDGSQLAEALASRAFLPVGQVYSPFGEFVDGIPRLSEFRILLAIRDPRDVLTSEYYSTAFSHPVPGSDKRDELLNRRTLALEVGVDRYVLERAPDLAARYKRYQESLLGANNVAVLKYEEMVSDLDTWLESLLSHSGLSLSQQQRQAVREEASMAGGGWSEKRRQVAPGDHRRSLNDSTVDALDRELADILAAFEYE